MVKQTRGYRVWDPQSEEALKAGVRKHGLGAWEHIRKDPQFAILSDRTGVQLKDKWRNLVKFRHIDPDEQRTYKPKTQGPWSKKYKRERSQGLSGTASPTSADGGATEDEGGQVTGALPQAAAGGQEGALLALAASDSNLQALQGQRHSVRSNAQKRKAITDLALLLDGDCGDACTGSEDEDGGAVGGAGGDEEGGEGSARRSRLRSVGRSVGRSAMSRHRKANEDRRFGIYDRRRYGFAEDGNGSARGRTFEGEGSDEANDYGPEGGGAPSSVTPAPPRGRRRAGATPRRAARGAASDEDEEEEDEDLEEQASEDGMDDGAAGSAGGGGGDEGAVQCPCGVTYDDGEMMIECESCATWAHLACLKQQMTSAPDRFRYNFETYHCVNCQEALSSLQHAGGGSGSGISAVALGRRGAAGRAAFRGMAPPPPLLTASDRTRAREQDGDHDTASEDSQRKASELSTILLGLANGKLGSGNSGVGGRRGMSGPLSNIPPHSGVGSSSRAVPFSRSSAPAGTAANTGMTGLGGHRNGSGGGGVMEAADGSSPTPRSASAGQISNNGLGGTAAAKAAKLRQAAENYISGCMHKPGQAAGDAARRPLVTGPASSTGSRGKLDGAGSPPPVPDAGLPLFQAAGSAAAATGGGSSGSKIFKPIPKLATAPALQHHQQHEAYNQQSHQQLSAPKPRPHPALQQGASPHDLQRLLEAANPHHGGGNGGRGMPLTSLLEAAGPLQVAAANLCAASGRKSTALAQAAAPGSAGGAGGASDGVGSSDAGAPGAASLPPRPPSRPASSMAREVANRIFGESDDDDAGGLNRSLFLLPPSLSRAATPSAWLDILRPTPDILMGPSPPLPLVGASSSVCSGSPSAACFTALLAQQQQAQQQFLNPSNAPPSASGGLQLQAPSAATAAPSIILPPLPLTHAPQPQPAFPPHPLTLDSTLPGWPAGAPPLPPPAAPHPAAPSGEQPVILHPLLRHIQQQLQQQHQQPSRGADGADQQPGSATGGGGPGGHVTAGGVTVKEEPGNGPSLSGLSHRAQQQQQQQREQQGPYSHAQQQGHDVASLRRDGAGGEDRCSAGGTGALVRPSSTQPLPQTSSLGFGQGAGRDMASLGAAALAAAAAAASAAASSSGSGLSQGLDGGGQSVAPHLGIGLAGLNLLDHCRSSSPESWSLLRTYTPLPEGVLQGFLHPFDINWLLNKSGTPPLTADLFGHSSASGPDLHLDR